MSFTIRHNQLKQLIDPSLTCHHFFDEKDNLESFIDCNPVVNTAQYGDYKQYCSTSRIYSCPEAANLKARMKAISGIFDKAQINSVLKRVASLVNFDYSACFHNRGYSGDVSVVNEEMKDQMIEVLKKHGFIKEHEVEAIKADEDFKAIFAKAKPWNFSPLAIVDAKYEQTETTATLTLRGVELTGIEKVMTITETQGINGIDKGPLVRITGG